MFTCSYKEECRNYFKKEKMHTIQEAKSTLSYIRALLSSPKKPECDSYCPIYNQFIYEDYCTYLKSMGLGQEKEKIHSMDSEKTLCMNKTLIRSILQNRKY